MAALRSGVLARNDRASTAPVLCARGALMLCIFLGAEPARAECASLVQSMCEGADTKAEAPGERKTLRVPVQRPVFAVGDRFPVEEHSIVIDPTRYGLPPVDGDWRYYELDGTVYRVDSDSALVLGLVREGRIWMID